MKFALMLGKNWFGPFNSREECQAFVFKVNRSADWLIIEMCNPDVVNHITEDEVTTLGYTSDRRILEFS